MFYFLRININDETLMLMMTWWEIVFERYKQTTQRQTQYLSISKEHMTVMCVLIVLVSCMYPRILGKLLFH